MSANPVLLKKDGRGPKPLQELLQDGLVTITPDLAHRIIQTGKFERQRPVRIKHVEALAQQMRRREWTAGTQIHFGQTPDGELHLVNGQRRMHAVVKADTHIPFQILVTQVSAEADLIRLYRRHDRLAAPRSVTDALAAEGIHQKYGLRSEPARATFGAVLLIENGLKNVRTHSDPYLMRSDEARLRLCEDWWLIAGLYQEAITNAPATTIKRGLQTAGTTAVALLTLRDQEVKAEAFWRGLADDDGLARSDPRKAYLRFLSDTGRKGGAHMLAKGASLAWNAFFQDETLEAIRVFLTPIEIRGVKINKTSAF